MEPISIGAGALGALETVTGGHAGPSQAIGGTAHGGNWNFGGLNVNEGIPTWAIVAGLALAAVYVFKR